MLTRLRLPLPVDGAALERDVAAIAPDDWVPHFNRHGYEGDWSGAPLRSIGGAIGHIYPDPSGRGRYADTPLLARCPGVAGVLGALECELLAVRLLRLGPGALVHEHSDRGLSYEGGELRVHVPVTTNPGVEFRHAGELVEMAPDEAWYMNLELPHSVVNRGDGGRVHLVVDCVRNAWVEELLQRLAGAALARATARHGGATVWLTGPAGAGRSALGAELGDRLARLAAPARLIDDCPPGDAARPIDGSPLLDAAAEALRAAGLGEIAVVASACPLREDRERARRLHEQAGLRFVEVSVETPAEVCALRVRFATERGLRPRRDADRIAFEAPASSEITVRADRQSVAEEAELVMTALVGMEAYEAGLA